MNSLVHSRIIARRRLPLADLVGLYRSRRALAALDAAALEDVGLTPSDAQTEARRAFWDVPCGWLRTAR